MGKGKLAKFAEMAENPLVVECPMAAVMQDEFPLRGRWHEDFFRNANPIVLELGCGRGEYTVGLGRQMPGTNFIGVDIKGARMWTGAKDALQSGMKNVGFLRTNIEFIQRFFAPGEVSEIWLTFSDPQMKKVTKRLTSTYFLERYRQFLADGGRIHLKTDSNFLFTYTEEMLRVNGIEPEYRTRNLYGTPAATASASSAPEGNDRRGEGPSPCEELRKAASSIQTYYESMWRARGIDIKYLCFRLPQDCTLVEPDIEIPLDEYRSYSREKRSSQEKHV
ncbi:MAG: tRNA (guanosine(46)-N7)-methyltransferase TrmB [Bacteroidaceae bacterium]|nr:tRNA (guanosine(46)-N7)-methyltransferase TrmB [Bacteroidaceae bacterium]